MKKKIISFVLSIVTIMSVCLLTVSATYRFVKFDGKTGNQVEFTETVKNVGRNTLLAKGQKSYVYTESNKTDIRKYSDVALYNTSEVKELKCWFLNENGEDRSEKYTVKAVNKNEVLTYKTRIPYNTTPHFGYGDNVCLWGEQYGFGDKSVQGILYCH